MDRNVSTGNSTMPMPLSNSTADFDCYNPRRVLSNGIWLGDNPLQLGMPLFLAQLFVISVASRLIHALIRPFGQPLVLAEILAGLLIGPSGLGAYAAEMKLMFPVKSISTLSSAANLGIMFYVFMVAVEIDVKVARQLVVKAAVFGTVSLVVPSVVTIGAAYKFRHVFGEHAIDRAFYIYLGIALSVTDFPLLARVLSDLRLLNCEMGQISLLASMMNGVLSLVVLAVAVMLTDTEGDLVATQNIILCGLGFVAACVLVVRPLLRWLMDRTPEGEPMSDIHLGTILLGVCLSGFVTDCIGLHYVFGAFVYGLVVPFGPHGTALVERLRDLLTSFFIPMFFAAGGLKADVYKIKNIKRAAVLALTFALSSIMKIVSTVLVAVYYNMSLDEGLSLGFLMNTKGVLDVLLTNIAASNTVPLMETQTVLLIMSVALTAITTPIFGAAGKSSKTVGRGYRSRNLMRAKPEAEMRVLSCLHKGRHVPSMLSLLDLSNPTKRCPIFVYALHLVELTGRASAMIVVHKTIGKGGRNNTNRAQAQSEHIISAFENYEQHTAGISVQPLTAICPLSSMHEDICSVAEDKHAAIILLPFHKVQAVDGTMEATPAIRAINQNVLNHAPCSVAILIDRCIGNTKPGFHVPHHITVLFFGGPHDREALAYAGRMAGNPSVSLAIVRFILGEDASKPPATLRNYHAMQRSDIEIRVGEMDVDLDQALDNEFVSEFRLKHLSDESIRYTEVVLNNSEETVEAINSLDNVPDLFVVGRSQAKRMSKLMAGLTEWSDCPELGPIGDLLASSDFGTAVSVLVVQQYIGPELGCSSQE